MKRFCLSLWLVLLVACGPATAELPSPTVLVPSATADAPAPTVEPTIVVERPDPVLGDLAPGKSAAIDTWTAGNKLGMGTAFTYNQPAGEQNSSRVWFAITNGAITEGSYPEISLANVKSLRVLVLSATQLYDEMLDAEYTVERLDGRTPAYLVRSQARDGTWAISKQVLSDPQQNSLVFTVQFEALQGQAEDYRVFLAYTPRIGNSGARDQSEIVEARAEAWDERAAIYTSLRSEPAALLVGTGYSDVNDMPSDLADLQLDTYYQRTEEGRATLTLELDPAQLSTLALGFGANREQARAASDASLERGFEAVFAEYQAGWGKYLDQLKPPVENQPFYHQSLAVIKAHEDKTHYGSFIASISMPWGEYRNDMKSTERGYRYVWPRDLYHTATALYLAGDLQSARDTVVFLDTVLQKNDGSFPQNAYTDGRLHWTGMQLDETSTPILLAWHVGALDRYHSLVQPAANYLVDRGPYTGQERWEENGGYSPATLASVVAALICAADLAEQAGELDDAERYRTTADQWNAQIEQWTLTTNGPLSDAPYYLRISDGDPNIEKPLTIANGGGTYDQREIVDQSFLELVRLGLRAHDDPNILATLELTNRELVVKTPRGEAIMRYQHDGYGEPAAGAIPDGPGQPWPLLFGERSVYMVQQGDRNASLAALETMAHFANQGGMLPEQVFADGTGTGSATPLVWAHAEYVVLSHAVQMMAIPDQPLIVAQRYLMPAE